MVSELLANAVVECSESPVRVVKAAAVVVKIIEQWKEKVLLLLEKESKPWKNSWDHSPIWWTVELWESFSQTAIREAKEEAWLEINSDQLIDKWQLIFFISLSDTSIIAYTRIFHVILNEIPTVSTELTDEIWGNSFVEINRLDDDATQLRLGVECLLEDNDSSTTKIMYIPNK